ncbi:MAG: sensor histidine kinase [Planctomycetota bacterium]
MLARRSLKFPITLAVLMIVLLVVLTVGWVLLAVFGAQADDRSAGLYWTLLSVGSVFFVIVLVGVVLYLSLTIKAIHLARRQENFIDSVTHELKSPIASLKLYLQTLSRRQVSEQERADFHGFMLEDLGRLDRLINHLLDAAKLDERGGGPQKEMVPLEDVLGECAGATCLCHDAPPSTVRLDTEPCFVRARRGDLEVIFRNLIDNAIKYAGSEPRVEVVLRMTSNGGSLTRIRDNGQGIPPGLQKRIFRRFERLGVELERERPGMGLGLYIANTLVRGLGGRIRVRGRVSTPGTEFEVQLPARAAPSGRQDPAPGAAAGTGSP